MYGPPTPRALDRAHVLVLGLELEVHVRLGVRAAIATRPARLHEQRRVHVLDQGRRRVERDRARVNKVLEPRGRDVEDLRGRCDIVGKLALLVRTRSVHY